MGGGGSVHVGEEGCVRGECAGVGMRLGFYSDSTPTNRDTHKRCVTMFMCRFSRRTSLTHDHRLHQCSPHRSTETGTPSEGEITMR